jgi:hypothetical protein
VSVLSVPFGSKLRISSCRFVGMLPRRHNVAHGMIPDVLHSPLSPRAASSDRYARQCRRAKTDAGDHTKYLPEITIAWRVVQEACPGCSRNCVPANGTLRQFASASGVNAANDCRGGFMGLDTSANQVVAHPAV